MRLRSFILLSATGLLLTACVTAKERHLEEGYRLLSGAEIRELHLDKTHEVKLASGKTAVAYFSADGRSTFKRSDNEGTQGFWQIHDTVVCYVYPDIPDTSENCHSVAVKNGQYVMFKEYRGRKGNISAEVVSITPGNAKNLPLE